MASTRVRYQLLNNNTLVSNQMLSVTQNDVVVAQILPETLTGVLLTGNNEVLVEVSGTSLHEVKKALKKALKQNGVNFLDEVRSKKIVSLAS